MGPTIVKLLFVECTVTFACKEKGSSVKGTIGGDFPAYYISSKLC